MKRVYLIIFLILAGLSYLLIVLFTVKESSLELARFRALVESGGPCHENCLLNKEAYRQELVMALKSDARFKKEVESLFLKVEDKENKQASFNFKKELLKIIFLAEGRDNPPDFLIDYLLNSEAESELKAEIINLFISSSQEPVLIDYYFSILESTETEVLKRSALQALSNLSDKNIFTVKEIQRLKNLILSAQDSLNFRVDLIFLLSDFFTFFPEETRSALTAVYELTTEDIVKVFTAETLNNLGFMEFVAPEASPQDWQRYFNN